MYVASIHRSFEVISQDRRLSKVASNKRRGYPRLRKWIVQSPSVGRMLLVRVWTWKRRWWLDAGYYDRRARCGAKLQCATELSASLLLYLVCMLVRGPAQLSSLLWIYGLAFGAESGYVKESFWVWGSYSSLLYGDFGLVFWNVTGRFESSHCPNLQGQSCLFALNKVFATNIRPKVNKVRPDKIKSNPVFILYPGRYQVEDGATSFDAKESVYHAVLLV